MTCFKIRVIEVLVVVLTLFGHRILDSKGMRRQSGFLLSPENFPTLRPVKL